MSDLAFDGRCGRGARGRKVRLVQEWLTLHGFPIVIDGSYGPATERAVRQFQEKKHLGIDGVVGKKTFEALLAPMRAALAPITPAGGALGTTTVAYAEQHARQAPREVGGQNMGPWVRLYMDGHEGAEWPWCAGFASFILEQASRALGVAMPIPSSVSCDVLAGQAKQRGMFLSEREARNRDLIEPGSLFLSRRTKTDWVHTGIVTRADADVFYSIEGNTNDSGDREGYEVCRRIRGYAGKDFVVFGALDGRPVVPHRSGPSPHR